MFTWILAQWEEYHTGVMSYGNSYYGVLEANYTLTGVHVLTAIMGRSFWLQDLSTILPAAYDIPVLHKWSEWGKKIRGLEEEV
jgi:ethanolaminephosphotransferase